MQKEKGLEPLAALITLQKAEKPIEVYAEEYVNPEKEVKSVKEAIDGAKDIIAESVSDEQITEAGSVKQPYSTEK